MKKGFTLVELLAVLVILGIISVVATPILTRIIDDAKADSKLRSAELYIEAARLAVLRERVSGDLDAATCTVIATGDLNCSGTLVSVSAKHNNATSGTITFSNGSVTDVEELTIEDESFSYNSSKNLVRDE